MSAQYYSASYDSTNDIAGLDDSTIWSASSWAIGYDFAMPRSMQNDLTKIDLALANDSTFGPAVTKPQDGMIQTFNYNYHFSPVPMARTTSDTSCYRSTQTPHHPRHMPPEKNNRKRNFRQVGMDFSHSYSHISAPRPSSDAVAIAQQPRIDEVQVYEPGDYCSKLADETSARHLTSKRQRVNGFDESQPFTWSSNYAPNMYVPMAHTVAPSANMMSTSTSTTHLSPSSRTSSEAMSRQSSVSSASVTDAFDMMRVESSFSTASDLFFPDQIDGSFVSCVTAKPVSRQSTAGLKNDGSHSLRNVGYVGANHFPFYVHDSSAAFAFHGQQDLRQAEDTHIASVGSAPTCDSTELKATQRRRKHIDNSRRRITPKSSTVSRTVRPSRPRLASGGSNLWQSPTSVSAPHPNTTQQSLKKKVPDPPKEAISKTPYIRPQHPKLYCNKCEESNGFRGEHELRRHWDREHAQRRKVWVCQQPSTRTEWWPAKPLSSCKQCKQQKQYNVYYNAAAHLRRAHFCPRKRGRKAKGEERESRAGKAGGDWPPIDWLKGNGWLKEIEVDSTEVNTSMQIPVESIVSDPFEEVPWTQPVAFVTKHDTFATSYLPTDELAFDQQTIQWHDPSYSIPMQETVSAPPCFPSTDAMGLYVANGYAF